MSLESHLVLHGIAVKKHASGAAIADLVGLDAARVETVLAAAVAGGRAAVAGDRYVLTPAGRMIAEAQYSRWCAQARADTGFVNAWRRFETLNASLKQVITDWQMRTVGGHRIANDHSDREHDEQILDRLGEVHERTGPIVEVMAAVVPRLGRYAARLGQALERADDGALEWVSDARIDSYHTVWFELHEDLLRILGQERIE